MLRIGTIVMGAANVRRAVNFWCQALNYVPRYEVADDWAVLVPADGRPGPGLSLARSETPVQDHPRVHPDLYAGDAADQAAEVERLIALVPSVSPGPGMQPIPTSWCSPTPKATAFA